MAGLLIGLIGGGALGAYFTKTYCGNEDDVDDGNKPRGGVDFSQYDNAEKGTSGYQAATDQTHVTHINFLSDVINRLWPKINVAGSQMMKDIMEPMFAETLPSMLSSLKFTTLDLGNVPIVSDNILVHELQRHPDTGMEYIQWDWDVSWNSSSNIQLSTSNNMVQFGVKSISLKGRMSFWMQPLTNEIPCLDAIQYAFVNPPEIELDFTGLANIADFKMMDIKGMIRNMMRDVVSSIMVLPVKMSFLMNPAVDYRDMYSSAFLGLARITAHSGRGFKPEKQMLRGHDIPDVYLKIKVGYEPEWKTKTIHNELNPKWDPTTEFHDFLLCSKEQVVEIEAWDEDGGAMDSDDYLGSASVTVGQILLLAKGAAKTMEVELMKKESKGSIKSTGHFVTVSLSILPFTTNDLSSVKQAIANKDKENKKAAGLLTVLIQGAHDLPVKKEEAASFVKVWCGEKELGVTGTIMHDPETPGYDALNPIYQTPFHLPLTIADLAKADDTPVKLQLINGESKVLGEIVVSHKDIVKAANGTIREKGKIGSAGAALSYQVMFSGIETNAAKIAAASALTASQTATISGDGAKSSSGQEMLRVSITKGYGFKSQKKGRFKRKDIPDVYCLIKFASLPSTWRTATVKDSETPTWKNETKEFPLQSANQVISIEVWDANSKSKDDLYGTARTSV
ncbi:MAG: hypothetical protein SGARI_000716, partial [Bacillariaceae sp.]